MRLNITLTQAVTSFKMATNAREVNIKERSKLTKEEWKEFTRNVWHIANVADSTHPAVFPREIPRRLIRLFTWVGETVLDPFAGIGTTGEVAAELERRAICVEQNDTYVEQGISNLAAKGHSSMVRFVTGDSRDLSWLEENSVELVVTSPPYWNKAEYGDGESNIGNIERYSDFLGEVRQVFRQCYRVLKAGRKICVVTANVNQYTDMGLLTFPLAADFTVILREEGFLMINDIIWSKDKTGGKWGSSKAQRPIFGSYPYPPNFLFKNVHEHILVFAKPGKPALRAPSYQYLMGRE